MERPAVTPPPPSWAQKPCLTIHWHLTWRQRSGLVNRRVILRISPRHGSKSMSCVLAKSLQLCPTLCNPLGCSPPGFSVHGILQARIPEWVAMPTSRGSSRPRDRTCVFFVSYIGRWVFCFFVFFFLPLVPPGKPTEIIAPHIYYVPGAEPNMLLEENGEIAPERMKRLSQSENNAQLWM